MTTREIKSFKMISGEEVVAEVVGHRFVGADSGGEAFILARPHVLQVQNAGTGPLRLAFIPWTLSNPTVERLEVPCSAIIVSYFPNESVQRQYLHQIYGPATERVSPN